MGLREVLLISFILLVLGARWCEGEGEGLRMDFYAEKCPSLEKIVKEEVNALYYIHGNTAVSFLRSIFHDCAVQGCDASLLLDSTPDHASEKESIRNLGMRNYKYIHSIKKTVEKHCPNTVSCADILMLAGREGITMLGGPYIPMKLGRRDSLSSSKEAADAQLPEPDIEVSSLLPFFASMNLQTPHVVALLGAHTVGRTHCTNLVPRLYPNTDPLLDSAYADYLKFRCPTTNPNPHEVLYARNDRKTPMRFDNMYYKNIMANKGLLKVDQFISTDDRTSKEVVRMANNQSYFFDKFVEAIGILSEHKTLTGTEGEIRRHCQFSN